MCLSLGNHDHRKNVWDACGKPSEGQGQTVRDKNVLVLERAPVRVLVLDSLMMVNEPAGLLGKTQRDWLDGFLRSSDETATLSFVHHNIGDGDTALLDSDRLMALVTPHQKVKAMF